MGSTAEENKTEREAPPAVSNESSGREDVRPRTRTRGNVLVVDDEVFIRNAFELYFKTIGFTVQVADSGASALEVIGAPDCTVEVVVLDLVMPGMKGLDVLAAIKSQRPDVEVIIATGCGTLSSAIAAMRSGAFDYITKPIFNFEEELLSVVEDALIHRRANLQQSESPSRNFGNSEFALRNLSLFERFVKLSDLATLWRKDSLEGSDHGTLIERLRNFLEQELDVTAGIVCVTERSNRSDSPSHDESVSLRTTRAWGVSEANFDSTWFSDPDHYASVVAGEVFVFPTESLDPECLGFDARALHETPMGIHIPLVLEGHHRGALFLFFAKRAEELKNADFLDDGRPYLLIAPLLASVLLPTD